MSYVKGNLTGLANLGQIRSLTLIPRSAAARHVKAYLSL